MNAASGALLTDFYQLTMLRAYLAEGMNDMAVFELFVRRLPSRRNFLVAAGLEQALCYLETLQFTSSELDWVRREPRLGPDFASYLEKLRFTGDVYAMPEGRVFFGNEPLLRVVAPLPEAQLVETRLVNLMQFQCMIASKAARCVLAAPGKLLVDFGLRRAHGAEAGLLASRAAYIAGFGGTATVAAAAEFGIPLFGTMAHSYVQAHSGEEAAFARFCDAFPAGATLLIDTYDTVAAARKVAALARELAGARVRIGGVRLDSGDLGALAVSVRGIFDESGLPDLRIFASGNLDEERVAALIEAGAPIDAFGIGTSLVTSADAPSLDAVYKLQEYAGVARRKRSAEKATWPGRKQVYRDYAADGTMRSDTIALEHEATTGEPLLCKVLEAGRRCAAPEPLATIRARAAADVQRLSAGLRSLEAAPSPYEVCISPGLHALADSVDATFDLAQHPHRAVA